MATKEFRSTNTVSFGAFWSGGGTALGDSITNVNALSVITPDASADTWCTFLPIDDNGIPSGATMVSVDFNLWNQWVGTLFPKMGWTTFESSSSTQTEAGVFSAAKGSLAQSSKNHTVVADGAGGTRALTRAIFFDTRFAVRYDYAEAVGADPTGVFVLSEAFIDANFTLPTPTATTGSSSDLTPNSAVVSGTIGPNTATSEFPVSYTFEYGLTTAYGSTTTETGALTGSGSEPVSEDLTGLSANTTYHFRLNAITDDGTVNGSDGSFMTSAGDAIAIII